MLEKPKLKDHIIQSQVMNEYNLSIAKLTFLPIGYDIHTAVYRVDTDDGLAYFLKLRLGDFDPITVAIPHFLSNLGIHAIIAPLQTINDQLFGRYPDYTLILYPFVTGKDGYEVRLEEHHWVELGATLNKVHAAEIPADLIPIISRESYNPAWREWVTQFQAQVEEETFADPVAEELSTFMKMKRQAISQMVRRADELAQELSQNTQDLVLCHSDAHPGNFLIANSGKLYLVNWDNPILAPRERDLMFFGSGMAGAQPGGWEERSFYQGYGAIEVDPKALAYYRYERIIEDIAEFCKQLLLTSEGGDDREQAYTYLTSSFEPGGVVEAAWRTNQQLAGGQYDNTNRQNR